MAKAKLYLDRQKTNGLYPIKVRVSHQNDRKYYSTGRDLSKEDCSHVMEAIKGERNLRRSDVIEIKNDLEGQLDKAKEAIRKLENRFSFSRYEEIVNSGKKDGDIGSLFDEYIKQLKDEGRLGTAASFNNAKVSLLRFNSRLSIFDVTREFLKKYQRYMVADKKTETTVGIYLRSLRVIFNNAIDDGVTDRPSYPFGHGKKKYQIPEPKRRKLALEGEDLLKLWNYEPLNEAESQAKDFWFISYLGNGLNFKDIALLRQSNIKGNEIIFIREKTKGKKQTELSISITDRLTECISKRRIHKIGKDPFVFDIINENDSLENQFKKVKRFIKTTNIYLKRIGETLKLPIPLTSTVSRHSYATIAKRSGISIEAISEALGHGDSKTTKNYLDSFPTDQRRQMAEKTASFGL